MKDVVSEMYNIVPFEMTNFTNNRSRYLIEQQVENIVAKKLYEVLIMIKISLDN